jgi:hypothetical protein
VSDYDNIVIDGSSPFGRALGKMWEIHARKAADYTHDPKTDPWENFTLVGEQLGIPKEDAVEALIAVKQARMKSLRGKKAQNESVQDTVLDRAVYAAIRLAMDLELGELRAEQQVEEIAASDAALYQAAPDTQPIWIPKLHDHVRLRSNWGKRGQIGVVGDAGLVGVYWEGAGNKMQLAHVSELDAWQPSE